MRLEEIDGHGAAEQRIKRLRAMAKAEKETARQLKAAADASADRLDAKKQKEERLKQRRTTATKMIRPFH